MTNLEQRVFVAGHRGMVGAAITRELHRRGYGNVLTRSREELDLENQNQVHRFFSTTPVDVVYLAAAKVGGILANQTHPVDFLYKNLMIQCNVIRAAYAAGVRKLLFLGSSCIYPREAPQPIREDALLTGPLESTNEPYAIAKIAGLKLCEAYQRQYGARFICAMPTNLYGQHDNYDLHSSHVLPALIRKFHEGRESGQDSVTIWGTGTPLREFLYVDDLAQACVMLMEHPDAEGIYNIGAGQDISIADLARLVARVVGYTGNIVYDTGKPDGTPRKLMDSSRVQALGWKPEISLTHGITLAYGHFLRERTQHALPVA
ncbi:MULTISPECIES: GDP-L-fucose synthase family protein [Achromobacter]|jgi:GDP-L-fucose synthase|uniref:GDP-L-fucose synthase n=1 Tax=Achromobacter denitrificans TaxID=32002 RepID=A0A3R9HD19_ACHDE|nr:MULTISPECIES: GDP-L-fucose synthase [Achromobacter]ASC66637.1 GDP-fucose synthetase [Achromobacter denitrificans]MBV2157949.1 GDP-L-fucose synthase [Achromobacter denitrificans]MDF3847460.1 GDP-L-fucose synthase [Achromobacter denitrificans]MDF3860144.1 GDP-L-fucose synthase [Achromobacter denitrificans]MDF3942452.1 GDP-L-fucose synthase [Achromobacter denitrificans]